jgi:hypothetical protein
MNDIEQLAGFTVAVLAVYSSVMNWKVYEISRILFYYFILDTYSSILSKKLDILIHHGFILMMYSNIYIFSVSKEDFLEFFKTLLLVETSTIFLVINRVITNKKWNIHIYVKTLNNVGFVGTFLYYRLYYYYYYILNRNGLLEMYVFKYGDTLVAKNIFYFNTYGFYLLNIYWALLVMVKVCKQLNIGKCHTTRG